MKGFATLGLALCIAAGQSYATHLNGKLIDADCYHKEKLATQEAGHKTYQKSIAKACAATATSSAYLLRVTSSGGDQGNTYKLDSAGNAKVAEMLRNGTLKPDKDGDVEVAASGKLEGSELLRIETIKADK